jgi:hypothetical protein
MPKLAVAQEVIEQKIYLIRGQRVMLSIHLANLYGVETRVLMQSVQRNIDRFPEDFMFNLTREEILNLSQIVISYKIKHAPRVQAFTEQGVAMLSGILRSKRAIQVNIAIMRAFVKLRQILLANKELALKLEQLESKIEKHDTEIQAIFDAIRQLMTPPDKPKRKIAFHIE